MASVNRVNMKVTISKTFEFPDTYLKRARNKFNLSKKDLGVLITKEIMSDELSDLCCDLHRYPDFKSLEKTYTIKVEE